MIRTKQNTFLIVEIICGAINRFPFDWKNPFGYLIAVITEYMIVMSSVLTAGSALTCGIGFYLFIIAMSKNIKANLRSMDRKADRKRRNHILKQLIEFLAFHSRVK